MQIGAGVDEDMPHYIPSYEKLRSRQASVCEKIGVIIRISTEENNGFS